jgi:hypothetical protein
MSLAGRCNDKDEARGDDLHETSLPKMSTAPNSDPSHNPVKAPFYALLTIIGILLTILWAARGTWLLALLFGIFALVCGFAVALARSSRNPRWFQSFLDKR